MTNPSTPPKSLMIIGIIALLWNLIGVIASAAEMMITPEEIAALSEAEQALHASSPSWLPIANGVAVTAGVIGSIGLIMKRSFATPAFLVSLLGVLVHMGYSILGTDIVSVMGTSVVILPMVVIIIAVLLWLYSRNAQVKGWLS